MEEKDKEFKNEHHITTPIIATERKLEEGLPDEVNLASSAGVSDIIARCGNHRYSVKFFIMVLAFLIIVSTLGIALYQSSVELTCEQKSPWMHLISLILNLVGITIVAFFLAKKRKKEYKIVR
jgi:hypothetical protein